MYERTLVTYHLSPLASLRLTDDNDDDDDDDDDGDIYNRFYYAAATKRDSLAFPSANDEWRMA